MFVLYDLLVTLVVVLVLVPWHGVLIATGRFTLAGLRQRLGITSLPPNRDNYRVVVHAVSVGEVKAAETLIREIGRVCPQANFIITTGNKSGLQVAGRLQNTHAQIADVQFLPWDGRAMLTRWLDQCRPDIVALIETELWPNLIHECARRRIPVCIVSGRIYPRDIARYQFARRFFSRALSKITWIGVQSNQELERFVSIGAPAARVHVLGNIKYDVALQKPGSGFAHLEHAPRLVVGGCTHDPEEQWLLASFVELRKAIPEIHLVLAPRHLRRVRSVERIVRDCGLIPARWSELEQDKKEWDVLLLDRMGFLSEVYALAEVIIVGGSFVDRGGHNILEAAAHKRPIMIGPYVRHFQNVVEDFHHANAILWLSSHREITATLSMLLNDPEKREELGEQAGKVLASGRGNSRLYAQRVIETMTARTRVESHFHSYAEQV